MFNLQIQRINPSLTSFWFQDSVVYGQYGEGVIGAGRYEGKFSDYGYTYSGAKKDDSFANTKKDAFTDIYSTGAGGQSPSVVVYPDYDYQDSIPVRNQPSTPKVC